MKKQNEYVIKVYTLIKGNHWVVEYYVRAGTYSTDIDEAMRYKTASQAHTIAMLLPVYKYEIEIV